MFRTTLALITVAAAGSMMSGCVFAPCDDGHDHHHHRRHFDDCHRGVHHYEHHSHDDGMRAGYVRVAYRETRTER